MLNNTSKLYFPKFVYEHTATINDKSVSVYRLDWSRKEFKCANTSAGIEVIAGTESIVKLRSFALPDSYLKEIRRLSWKSVGEWNTIRLLPDSMKGVYLRPSAECVNTAFYLLADCLYDGDTKFYDRSIPRNDVYFALIWKFWKNQVNRQLLYQFLNKEDNLENKWISQVEETSNAGS